MKPHIQSRTIQGILVTAVGAIAMAINADITHADIELVVGAGVTFVGLLVTLWGRLRQGNLGKEKEASKRRGATNTLLLATFLLVTMQVGCTTYAKYTPLEAYVAAQSSLNLAETALAEAIEHDLIDNDQSEAAYAGIFLARHSLDTARAHIEAAIVEIEEHAKGHIERVKKQLEHENE